MADKKNNNVSVAAAALGGAVIGGALVALAIAARSTFRRRARRGIEIDDGTPRTVSRPAVDARISRHFVYPRDVRPESKAGALTNPHVEYHGDPWDRQRVMEQWDQGKVEQQVCLVLGAGGLGQSVAFALARMGVAKIILLDMDYFEATNLNRQILGTVHDVGRRKVDVAESGLNALHNIRSQIVKLHINAVTHWYEVVNAAKESSVIFNCIDYGAAFDYAANSLSKALAIPFISGSSYTNTMIADYYSGEPGKKCWSCFKSISESFTENDSQPDDLKAWAAERKLTSLTAKDLAAYHEQRIKINAVAAGSMYEDALKQLAKKEKKAIITSITVDQYKKYRDLLKDQVILRLSPTEILEYQSIAFIPQDKHAPTRQFGSWVCACTGAALLMVNAWAQAMMGNEPPSYANFSLRECRVNQSTADGATPESDSMCEVCRAVAHRLPRPVVAVTTPAAAAAPPVASITAPAVAPSHVEKKGDDVPVNMTASGQIPVAL